MRETGWMKPIEAILEGNDIRQKFPGDQLALALNFITKVPQDSTAAFWIGMVFYDAHTPVRSLMFPFLMVAACQSVYCLCDLDLAKLLDSMRTTVVLDQSGHCEIDREQAGW
jgi:hypothetical protein